MSDALQLISMCNKSYLPVLNQPQLVYVLTELFPGQSVSNVRLPLNFTLLLDRSGSMAGKKLRTMKEAVKNIIHQLDPNDIISIITFETKTQVLFPAQPARDKPALLRQVDKIRDGGGTNLAAGLCEALNQVRQAYHPNRISRVVLLTDGEVTDNENDSRQFADQAGILGIPIIGLGFGEGWKEEFIIDLADRSKRAVPGSHTGYVDYIKTPETAAQIFQQVFEAMQVIAQDVNLTLRMVQGIEARRVWQVVPLIKDLGASPLQGRSVVISAGDLEKGGAAFLVELMLPPRPAGAVRIAQSEATYVVPGQPPQRAAVDLVLNFTPDPALAQPVNGHVMNIIEKVQAFKLQTQALSEAETGNVRGATQKLRQAVTILLSQGDTELAHQMSKEADRLEQSGEISNEGKKTIKLTARKTVKLSDIE